MIAQKTDTTAPSARKSHIGIVYSILMVLLLLVLFLLSPANKVYASVVLTAVLVIATGLFGREELDETKMSLPMILCLFGLADSPHDGDFSLFHAGFVHRHEFSPANGSFLLLHTTVLVRD